MKKVIRLTESDLHRIIKESVKRILKEDSTFDNHIAGNIFDDIIQRGIYRRIQPKQLKDYIMRAYGLNTGEEGVADIVVDKVIKYKLQMEEQYGLTEANWSNALTDPGNEPDDKYEWTDNDEVDLQHEYEKEKRLREPDLHRIVKESVKRIVNENIYEKAEEKADKIANFIGYEDAFRSLANLICMEDPRKLLEYVSKIEQQYHANGIV